MVLGVIPARGGSKGIPGKNIKTIAGKPLIVWTVEAAGRSALLDRFVVSTDDPEIADVAKKHGAEVVIRPPELARDDTPTLLALQHVMSRVDADTVVLLQPTSPVRDEDLIDDCIRSFMEKQPDTLVTGFECKYKEYGTYTQRRQDLNGFFYDDGNVVIYRADLLREGKTLGEKAEKIMTTREQNIEIDDEFDFWLAEQILIKRLKRR